MVLSLMTFEVVPGLSIAIVREREIAEVAWFGIRNPKTREKVDSRTVFKAASLSKPVFSYVVLKLVDEDIINLDQPLSELHAPLIPDDHTSRQITARHVLSHMTGLPNWRREEFPLRTYFTPGNRFSYSGEAYVYLQAVIEGILGEDLNTVAKRYVFDPLSMPDSSFTWRESYEENHAVSAHEAGELRAKFKPSNANAAYSLHTTASDFARFMIEVLGGSGLKPATALEWLRPHVFVPRERFEALELRTPDIDRDVAWGLGWGTEITSGNFFHWGSNPGAQSYAIGSTATGSATVMFTNSDNGLSIVSKVVSHIMPGAHPAFAWLGLS